MIVKCVVAAMSGGVGPDFYFCKVDVPAENYDVGIHYEIAEDAAEAEGYDRPMVAFDENDGPEWLFEHFNWDNADIITGDDD